MVVEFIKISKKTAQTYRRTQIKHRKAKKGHDWTKLERIKMDCIKIKLKNVGPPFSNLYQFISKCNLHGRNFANDRLLLCQFDI